MATQLPISETFKSLQGEGFLTGVPSFFIRFSGCNLRCKWCDTPYASWDPETEQHSMETVIDLAKESHVKHIVVTGGEPMMFEQIEQLTKSLNECGFHITIETAGTIARNANDLHCDLMSISPKLSNSTPDTNDPRDPNGVWQTRHEARRLNIKALQDLLSEFPNYQLKFVVQSPSDVQEIDLVLNSIGKVEPFRVMLMPEGITIPEPASVQWIVDLCMQRGWRYCPRLQIALFGNTRGT